jgi:membrane protein implicated in regulation of membrane protease activity
LKRWQDLIVANVAAFLVLVFVLVLGWQEAAAFGLAVLVIMDLLALIRARQVRRELERKDDDDQGKT